MVYKRLRNNNSKNPSSIKRRGIKTFNNFIIFGSFFLNFDQIKSVNSASIISFRSKGEILICIPRTPALT